MPVSMSGSGVDLERLFLSRQIDEDCPSMEMTLPTHVIANYVLLDHGCKPSRMRVLGNGAHGNVIQLEYKGGQRIALKNQQATPHALTSLRVAAALKSARVVNFRPVIFRDRLLTFMSVVQSDLEAQRNEAGVLEWRKKHADTFIRFLEELLACLKARGAYYPDMKLANVAYCNDGGNVSFSVIDVDSFNGHTATFPAREEWTIYHYDSPAEGLIQTKYACAVTAFLYHRPNEWPGFAYGKRYRSTEANLDVLRQFCTTKAIAESATAKFISGIADEITTALAAV
jgi:hypothetical protein